MALALGSSNRSVVNSQRSYPLWGYRFAPVAIIVIRQEPFVFNGLHLPAMWRARSIEVSAATNDAPLPSFVFVSSLLTMSYSVSSSSSAGGHAQGDGRGRDGVEIPCGVEVHSGRYGGLGHAGRLAQGLLFEFFLGQVQAHVPRGDFPQAFSQFDCLCPCRGVAGHVRSFRLRALGGLCAPCYGRRAWLCNTTASPVRSGRTGPGKTWETKALRTVLALGAELIDNLGRDSERFK